MKSKRFVSKMDTLDDMLSCIHRSLYFIKAVCCNKQFKVMIDSGAQTSIMSYHMMQQLQLQHGLDKTHKGYATGVGKAKIHGVIKHCDVNVDNIVITTNFKVMDTDTMDDTTTCLSKSTISLLINNLLYHKIIPYYIGIIFTFISLLITCYIIK